MMQWMKPVTRLAERLGVSAELRANPDLQSALVRFTAVLCGTLYLGLGAWTHYYRIDILYFLSVALAYLGLSLLLVVSVARRPLWIARRYLALCLDMVVVSLAIAVTEDAISPFYLLYVLIFISAGTRFGKGYLIVAAVVAVVAYNLVLIELDEWRRHPFEAAFFLVLLVLLPLYQTALLRKVQQARDDAERANRAKGDFLAFMTHELRTPLTGVIGMTHLLRTTELSDEQADYVDCAAASAGMLNALIGGILDFSKIEARKLKLEQIPFEPRSLVLQVAASHAVQAASRGIDLSCEIAPEVPQRLLGDELRCRQILFNLLNNAVKFTERGEVAVRLVMRPGEAGLERPHLLLEVADTGIGIPADTLAILFESFRQADDSTTRRYGGTGLGTTIARELTLLMGGTIEVTSGVGVGSCFRVRLPLRDADELPAVAEPAGPGQGAAADATEARRAAPATDAPAATTDRAAASGVPAPGAPLASPAGAADGPRLVGRRILVSEPNATQRALLQRILDREQASLILVDPADGIQCSAVPAPECLLLAEAAQPADLAAQLAVWREGYGAELPALFVTYPGRLRRPLPPRVTSLTKPFLDSALIQALTEVLIPDAAGQQARVADVAGAYQVGPTTVLTPLPHLAPVLVAEDNPLAAKVLTTFLRKLGVDYQLFEDGEAALAAALGGGFGLAIVDMHMPKRDGIGFAQGYRAAANVPPLPIVALTANASEDARRQCLEAGMDGFLAKPVSPAALRTLLETQALRQA